MTFKMPVRGEPFVRHFDGHVQSVLVAVWPEDEVELWRVGLWRPETPGLRIFRLVTGYPYYDTKTLRMDHPDGSFIFILPNGDYGDFLPYLRWAAVEFGLVDRGTTPLLTSHISKENPWVGRFVGRTMADVERDAAWFDKILKQNFAHEPYMALFVPFTNDERRRADLFAKHFPKGWKDRPIVEKGAILFDLDVWLGESTVDVESGRSYIIDVSRFLASHSDTNVARLRHRSLVEALPDLVSFFSHPSWAVLPADEADRWWDEHRKVGVLVFPADDLEIFRLLGEPPPFLWVPEKLQPWADQQWPEQ